MNALTVAYLALAFLVALVVLVRRGLAGNRAWTVTIAEHAEATGDYPTVADWRAGRLAHPDDPAAPAGPAVITVTVLDVPRAELTRGAP